MSREHHFPHTFKPTCSLGKAKTRDIQILNVLALKDLFAISNSHRGYIKYVES